MKNIQQRLMINMASALKNMETGRIHKSRVKPNIVMNPPIYKEKSPCSYKYIKGTFAFDTNYLRSRDKATKNAKRKNKKTLRRTQLA